MRPSVDRTRVQILLMTFQSLCNFVQSTLPQFTQLYSMNSFHAVIAARLNASQRSRVGVGMNMSARGEM